MAVQKKYYSVAVTYRAGAETKYFSIPNLDGISIKNLRDTMFIGGVYRRIDDDTGEVISPWCIIETMIYKQAHFFKGADLDKKLVKS